jgi:hypothetical protein
MIDRSFLHALRIGAALASVVAVSFAVASDCETAPTAVCSRCSEKVCVTFVMPATETKTCWDVECEEVCIPAVRCPWHHCSEGECDNCGSAQLPGCGEIRGVRKLKQVEYECDTCRYEHRIVCRCPNCGPVPHAEYDCVPLASTTEQETARAVAQFASAEDAVIDSQSQQTESVTPIPTATPEAAQTEPKPRWTDRLRARLVNWKHGHVPQPGTDEGDLSQLIGHTRFAAAQAD